MKSAKAPDALPKPEPMRSVSSTSTNESAQYTPVSSSASPLMSPSAFANTSPTTPFQEARPPQSFSIPLPFQSRPVTGATTTDNMLRSETKSPRKSPPTSINTRRAIGSTSPPPAPPSVPVRTVSEPAISPTSPNDAVSPSRTPTLKRSRKTSGTTSHCGRHSNDWLFGGISVRETVKGIWKDGDGHDR